MAQSGKIPGSRRALRAQKKERKENVRQFRKVYFLACEGKKTEPEYFNNLKIKLKKQVELNAEGDGFNTLGLIDWAKDEAERMGYKPNEVWILMDKDSFPACDFDNAINKAIANGYNLAWSNECFELWVLLHFQDVTSSFTRDEIYKKLTKIFGFNYEKLGKSKNIYELIRQFGGDETAAIRRADRLWNMSQQNFTQQGIPYSKANPATGIHILVQKLNEHIEN